MKGKRGLKKTMVIPRGRRLVYLGSILSFYDDDLTTTTTVVRSLFAFVPPGINRKYDLSEQEGPTFRRKAVTFFKVPLTNFFVRVPTLTTKGEPEL